MTGFHWIVIGLVVLVAIATSFHAMLTKRDPRTAFGWIAVCVLFPVAGPVLYSFFGVNRIRTRARRLGRLHPFRTGPGARAHEAVFSIEHASLPAAWTSIARVSDTVAQRPLVGSNRIEPLFNGEQAFPAMLAAIEEATETLYLSTYIFQTDETGRRFVDALAGATARGVDVRVIVDGIGERYSPFRRVGAELGRRGVRFARFLPPSLFPPSLSLNLRNHRKLLVVDGRLGFTGGVNIADRHLATAPEPPRRASDLHFRVAGPVVAQMEHAFIDDWRFCTGEELVPTGRLAGIPEASDRSGSSVCRTVVDGPSEELDSLAAILLGGISAARDRVWIMTPYFLPSGELTAALQTAIQRKVDVSLILPARSNLPVIQWATTNLLWEILQWGGRVYYQPPPFCHTKLMLVDDFYLQIGSANIDPRSLRLNFELNLEVFDESLSRELGRHFEEVRSRSRSVTLAEVDGRSLPVRVRDAAAWLFSPYM